MTKSEILALYLEIEVGFGETAGGGGNVAEAWAKRRVLRCGADLHF